MSSSAKILQFVSGNRNKLAELRARLIGTAWTVESHPIDLVEIQGTPRQIVTAKAREAFAALGGETPVLIEDSSLEFAHWNGLPGPYIKFFWEARGSQGLIDMLATAPAENRTATARCLFAYCDSANRPVDIFEATRTGTIVADKPRGTNGFGWDDIFVPDGHVYTYGEMKQEIKVAISARSGALDTLCSALST
jgi:inosine triphosphate pyrophosphatase